MKNKIYAISIALTLFAISCKDESDNSTSTNNMVNTTVVGDTTKNEETDVTKITQVANIGVELIKDGIAISKNNQDIRNANKDQVWVYIIGKKYNDDKLAGQAYDKIKSINNIYVFKKERGEYYLIKDDGYTSEKQLFDSLNSTQKQLLPFMNERLQIKNLALECSSRKQPTVTDNIKYKIERQTYEVKCLICD